MSYNYLDKTGLASVWAKIKAALATKANIADLADIAISGSYEDLNDIPEILTTNDDVVTEDKVPYLFRKSPDSDRAVESIVGGTVAWNQMINPATKTNRGVTATYDASTNIYTFSGETTASYVECFGAVSVIKDHKYLMVGKILANPNNITIISGILSNVSSYVRYGEYAIVIPTNTAQVNNGITGFSAGTDFSGVKMKYICSDLTACFGTTIADYIYSLEQSTAGAGVSKLKEWGFFTEDYYEYCQPTLKSVEGLVSKKTVGFNQWDGKLNSAVDGWKISTNYMPVVPGETYYTHLPTWSSGAMYAETYDAGKTLINGSFSLGRNETFTVPNNVCFLKPKIWHTADETDICINLSDPTRNGQYEPYESHTYSLDSEVVLRGVLKLDSNNNLYFDGDIYPSDGNGSRRYGLLTLDGSSDETFVSGISGMQFGITISDIYVEGKYLTDLTDIICDKLTQVTQASYWGINYTFSRVGTDKRLYFKFGDDITTEAQLRTYLASNPITFLYRVATPTTFTAQPYHNPQIVGDTEEFVTTGLVPVGHSTKYHTSYYTTNDYIEEKGYLTEKDILGKVNTSDLATVATSGSYNDLDDKPTIPTNEIFVGSTTPSGYTLYIDPEGSLSNGEGVSF